MNKVAARSRFHSAMLSESILPTLLSAALPTTISIAIPILATLGELYFLSFLGTDTVAAISLVFPIVTTVHIISSGDIGGAISGAIARALGADAREHANAFVLHSVVLATGFGTICAVLQGLFGPNLYQALGASGSVFQLAIEYSNWMFFGSVCIWMANQLAAVLRGGGDIARAAQIMIASRIVTFPLYPLLIYGWGPFPPLGIRGAALVDLAYYALSCVGFIVYLRGFAPVLHLSLDLSSLRTSIFREILYTGGILATRTMQSSATMIVLAYSAGILGPNVLAGYGIASRLDAVLITLTFGFGTSILIMTATNIGAGHSRRAYLSAIIGVLFIAGITEAIGLTVAAFPKLWMSMFSADPLVVQQGSLYLQIVGPCYGLFGAGATIYFVAQATKYLRWNFLAAVSRLIVVATGCAIASQYGAGIVHISITVAASYLIFALINALTFFRGIGWSVANSVTHR
jgi:MATE family, multidrug efflux pump